MKKLDWYIVRKFIGTFIYAIALIILIVIVFDVSEKIKDFIQKDAPLRAIIFDYYINFIPYFVNMFSGLFTFIAVIFFTSRMAANTEIVAILSSGVSFRRLLRPYLLVAIFIALTNLFLSNFIIPNVNKKRMAFENTYIWSKKYIRDFNIHFQYDDSTYYYAESFDIANSAGYRFTQEVLHPETGMSKKINAESVRYDSATNEWTLFNYHIRNIDSLTEKIETGYEKKLLLPIRPGDFDRELGDVTCMNYRALQTFIDREKLRGSSQIRAYEYERLQRIAHPFATLVFTLIGVAISSRKQRGGTGLHLAIGLFFAFTFVLFLQLSRVFATFGTFPVWLAAWLPIILYGLIAMLFLRSTPK